MMATPERTPPRTIRRDMTRNPQTAAELDAAAKCTPLDGERAANTWRGLPSNREQPRRGMLQAPEYTGDGVPSDAEREP